MEVGHRLVANRAPYFLPRDLLLQLADPADRPPEPGLRLPEFAVRLVEPHVRLPDLLLPPPELVLRLPAGFAPVTGRDAELFRVDRAAPEPALLAVVVPRLLGFVFRFSLFPR